MRGVKSSISLVFTKHIILSLLVLGTILTILTWSFTSSPPPPSPQPHTQVKLHHCPSKCDKIPPTLSSALIHYATTNITPQQTPLEMSLTERVLHRKSPCNFLVFGLGHDSLLWASLNHGGKTVFLEEDSNWIRQMNAKFPALDSRHVEYHTKVRDAIKLLASAKSDANCYTVVDPRESNCTLALKNLPREVYEVEWDVVMVDAPTGYHDNAPGRMQAVYTAGLLGRRRQEGDVDVFVHDVDREVENVYSKEYLCEGYMIEEEGKLRHFRVPSHRTTSVGIPFCPTNDKSNVSN